MIDEEDAGRDRARGLDPRLKKHEYFGSFTLTEAMRSLSETSRSRPVTVTLRDTYDDTQPKYPIVISAARPLWIHADIGDGDHPNWTFEGWILSFGPHPITRVRIHVATTDSAPEFGQDDIFTWQRFVSEEYSQSVSWR